MRCLVDRLSFPSMTAAVWLLAVATPAHAYLDPSTGSMILSAVVGLLATLRPQLQVVASHDFAFAAAAAAFAALDARAPGLLHAGLRYV